MPSRSSTPPVVSTSSRGSSWRAILAFVLVGGSAASPAHGQVDVIGSPDTLRIAALAEALAHDSLRGRGPLTEENARVAHHLAALLDSLGAQPLFGSSLLVPIELRGVDVPEMHNVAGVLPNRAGSTAGPHIGLTTHFDHLGIGPPDASGDSIYNGFLDAAVPVAMVMELARLHADNPGERSLVVMLMNLEEQGLLGSQALLSHPDAVDVIARLELLIGVDAGSPAGEAVEWQLMGGLTALTGSPHPHALLADSLARDRGWTTASTPPRRISDVYLFSIRGVPILFPIPGARWEGFTEAERDTAMERFDHYHQPSDQPDPAFPWVGTWHYATWLHELIVAMGTR